MGLSPIITHVLSVQSLAADRIFVGLIIDDERIVWGDCVQAVSHKQSELYPAFDAGEAQKTIQDIVVPILTGQPLKDLTALVARVDAIKEQATIVRQRTEPATTGVDVSRRALITGRLWATSPGSEQVTVERPLHPAIRYGVSQALASGLAQEQDVTLTELLAAEYDLPLGPRPVPIHLDLDDDDAMPDASLLSDGIGSLGTRITADDPQAQLGSSGERLQKFVRQMAALIDGTVQDKYQPAIHLDAAGCLGQLFDNDAGRILGALYGLEQAAKPYPLRVSDPALLDDQGAHIELMGELKDYIRMRGMSVQLAASARSGSLAEVKAIVEAEAAHLLTLPMSCLGSIQQTVEAILACQRGGMAVLLEGPAETAVHVALATQPDLIAATAGPHGRWSLPMVHDEMARTLAWLTAKSH